MNTTMKLASTVVAIALMYACARDVNDEAFVPASLSFALEVHNGVTKNSFRIKERGTLKIKNKSGGILHIEAQGKDPPFDDVPGYTTPQWKFDVPANTKREVTIADTYKAGDRFTYSSQIDGSQPDDPIVIIE